MDLSQYDALIVISGDGLLHEIINALCKRDDSEEARMCPVSCIPSGSANAFAKVLCEKSGEDLSVENCAYIASKGNLCPLDISMIKTESGRVIYSFLSFAWAFIADVDIESEIFRCCGGCRFDIYGF